MKFINNCIMLKFSLHYTLKKWKWRKFSKKKKRHLSELWIAIYLISKFSLTFSLNLRHQVKREKNIDWLLSRFSYVSIFSFCNTLSRSQNKGKSLVREGKLFSSYLLTIYTHCSHKRAKSQETTFRCQK